MDLNNKLFETTIEKYNKYFEINIKEHKNLYEKIKKSCENIADRKFQPALEQEIDIELNKIIKKTPEEIREINKKVSIDILDSIFKTNFKDNSIFNDFIKDIELGKESMEGNKKLREIVSNELLKTEFKDVKEEKNINEDYKLKHGNNYFLRIEKNDNKKSYIVLDKDVVEHYKSQDEYKNNKIIHYEIISDELYQHMFDLDKKYQKIKKELINYKANELDNLLSNIKKACPNISNDVENVINKYKDENSKDTVKNECKDLAKIFDKEFKTNLSGNDKMIEETMKLTDEVIRQGGLKNVMLNNKELMKKLDDLRDRIHGTRK